MPTETICDWDRITFARARVLRELADGRTEHEIAEAPRKNGDPSCTVSRKTS